MDLLKSLALIIVALECLQQFAHISFTASCSNAQLLARNRINNRNQINRAAKLGFQKRQENLCPFEYQACECDYTNINSNPIDSSSSKFSNSKSSSTFSIMIDCQIFDSDNAQNDSSRLTAATSKMSATREKKLLYEIPKIATSSSSSTKFKYLNHIIHLDLSRTAISEVSTDAFHGLPGLETIVITNCKHLVKIRMFAFRNLPNLKTLIISNNPKLVELEAHAFGSLRNLNYLSLSMNQLSVIDGYIFSTSTSIKIIDFIGNPIKRIKSHAFHGLRNVSDLLLSLNQNVSPIEEIEGDSFISTVFVDQIFLEGIPAKVLHTNAFRGLSYCKHLYLSNSQLHTIQTNAFYHANNIKNLSLINSRISSVDYHAFNGIFNVDIIDLRGNYLTQLNKSTFEPLIFANRQQELSKLVNESIILVESEDKSKNFVKKILFEQNPIQCDCNMAWILNNPVYSHSVTLPEICAGPKGYDCLRLRELNVDQLPCSTRKASVRVPCEDLVFDVEKDVDMYSLSGQGKQKGSSSSSSSSSSTGAGDDENDPEKVDYYDGYGSEEEYQNEQPNVEGPKPGATSAAAATAVELGQEHTGAFANKLNENKSYLNQPVTSRRAHVATVAENSKANNNDKQPSTPAARNQNKQLVGTTSSERTSKGSSPKNKSSSKNQSNSKHQLEESKNDGFFHSFSNSALTTLSISFSSSSVFVFVLLLNIVQNHIIY